MSEEAQVQDAIITSSVIPPEELVALGLLALFTGDEELVRETAELLADCQFDFDADKWTRVTEGGCNGEY